MTPPICPPGACGGSCPAYRAVGVERVGPVDVELLPEGEGELLSPIKELPRINAHACSGSCFPCGQSGPACFDCTERIGGNK